MKKKIVSTILCVAMMAMTLVGCGSSNKSGSVYWLNFKPESDEVLQDIAQTYTDLHSTDRRGSESGYRSFRYLFTDTDIRNG